MKKIFYIFLSRPVTTCMFFLSILLLGITSLFNLPVELTPNVEYPSLSVTAAWPGVSPEAVEAFLTSPMEAELATITGIKKISSSTSEGQAYISIEFHPTTDINFTRIEINEKLASLKAALPVGVLPPQITPYIPKDFRDLQGFIVYSVSSGRTANELRMHIINNVLVPLRAVKGVANIEVYGGADRMIEIILDYDKINSLGINEEEINNAILEAEIIKGAGKLQKNNNQIFVKINNTIKDSLDIQNQVIKILPDGQTVRVKDIARVIDGFDEPQNYYRVNGKETVTINISKEPGANALLVSSAVKNKIEEFRQKFPPDYTFIKEIDKSESMSKDLNELYRDGLYSVVIIFIVILLLFGNIRYPFIIIISLLFSFLSSFILFYLLNISLNILTIASFIIGFGFKVDNSIVVLDYLDRHYSGQGIKKLTVLTKEIFLPLFTSTFTIIALFIPLIFLTGELKLYFSQFALGICSTLLSSLIVSFTVVPLLFKMSHNTDGKESKELWIKKSLYDIYVFILTKTVKYKKTCIAFLILLIGLPVWEIPARIEKKGPFAEAYNSVFDSEIYLKMKPYINYIFGGGLNLFFNHISRGEIWNYGNETYLTISMELPNGNRIETINQLCRDLENEILTYKNNIKMLVANVVDKETAILRVEFTPEQAYTQFPYLLKNYVTVYSARLGGVNTNINGFGPGFSNEAGTASYTFNVTVKGFNYEKVKAIAENLRDEIKREPRIEKIDIDRSKFFWIKDTYEVVALINRDKLSEFNISVEELFSVMAKYSGGNIGYERFRINNEEIGYRVKFSNYDKVQLSDLENLIVSDKFKEELKIKDILDFRERKVQTSIDREDQQYIRNIGFKYKGQFKYGRSFLLSSISHLSIPEGYTVKLNDNYFMFGEGEEIDLLKVFAAALLIVIMISAALFESFKKSLIIITAIPYALIGSVFVFWLGNYTIERGAYAGMLLLIGLSVSNSIVMVNSLSEKANTLSLNEIIIVSRNRLRAILTTSITTFAALIPFVISNDSVFWKNLSISIIGGIIISSLYIVLFLPLMFIVFSKKRSKGI